MVLTFFVSELDLDLKGLDSRACEGGLYDEVYCGNCLSLEYERALYLGKKIGKNFKRFFHRNFRMNLRFVPLCREHRR